MSPDQFLAQIRKQPAGAYLFVGPDIYQRDLCRKALIERMLPEEDRASGLTRHELEEVPLSAVLDDARSFSLFSSSRVIWVAGAEAALPRGRAASEDSEDSGSKAKSASDTGLGAYLKNPTPGVVIVFDCNRYDLDGEDKAKVDRVRKFYSDIEDPVEFPRYSVQAGRVLAQKLAAAADLRIDTAALEMLSEALGGDAGRIAMEIEKLALFAGPGGRVTAATVAELSPSARTATIFGLVASLGRGERVRSLDLLDTLVREGEYLPLALTFIGTQFRLALAAKEAGLNNASQIQAHFTKMGLPMWRSRAEQVQQTAGAFSKEKLEKGLKKAFETDRALRDARPDDRTVMEDFVLSLTR